MHTCLDVLWGGHVTCASILEHNDRISDTTAAFPFHARLSFAPACWIMWSPCMSSCVNVYLASSDDVAAAAKHQQKGFTHAAGQLCTVSSPET